MFNSYTYTNRLRQVSPQQKLLFAIILLLISLMTHPITEGLIFIWLGIWIVGYARIPMKIYLRVVMLAGVFWLTSIPALVLEVIPREQMALINGDQIGGIYVSNWYLFISYRGVMEAFKVGMRSLAGSSCLIFILLTIPFTDLLYVLRKWGVPTLLTELLLLMYRFIFLFLDQITELQLAQQARGGYRTRKRWLYSVGLLVGQLLVRSLLHYQELSLALKARGFNGEFRVLSGESYYYSSRYGIESLIGCFGLIILDLVIYVHPYPTI